MGISYITSPTSPTSPIDPAGQDRNALPQYGFSTEVSFEKLVDSNPFLFRVHTPRSKPTSRDATESCFIRQMFTESFTSSAFLAASPSSPLPHRSASAGTYADVANHLDWTTRSTSPYVSTSFSFAWAIWEATRRYHHSLKHSVEIAVIDAKAVSGRAVTAVELLRQAGPKERHKDHWKWYRFALESQDVLIWGYIPETAVLASIPLTHILNKLPSYCLLRDAPDAKDSPMSRLGWDYTRKKPSYRQFCQEMADRFLRLNVDRRVRDSTAGAVRLALCLLRPWFHKLVLDDLSSATVSASELAYIIARWPGLWWVREHPEIRDLIRCMIHIVAEEVREARKTQTRTNTNRMEEIVGGLERLVQLHQARALVRRRSSAVSPPAIAEKQRVQGPPQMPASADAVVQTQGEKTAAPQVDEKKVEVVPLMPLSGASDEESKSAHQFHLDALTRVASCFFTGFFLGSLIALCALSHPQPELAYFT
ncbi:hypothetical protein CERSUDRAFT_114793 [Gelatoporia subvermispora B]|uniref:DUF7587 domain-containing protein n=1 Tax=Ceriporiopsis subvermispora (strain B) TaxID=914234 RepID=M2QXM9_CERS8|nr:hypothetical protein CERSUDRAFT_114793 [Gelatoporia subvermispora B]